MVAWPGGRYMRAQSKRENTGLVYCSTALRKLISRWRDFAPAYANGVTWKDENLAISYQFAEGKPERLPEKAAALAQENPDLILAVGGDVAPFAAKATSTIPIVFYSSADPVQLGLAASLARPGRNATGITLLQDDLASKRLELLEEAVPGVSHVAFLYNPDHPDNELREARRAADSLGIRLEPVRNARLRRFGKGICHSHRRPL